MVKTVMQPERQGSAGGQPEGLAAELKKWER